MKKKLLQLFLLVLFANQTFSQSDTSVVYDCDGRFTLGVKQNKIMYGYPNPLSTSHFVVKVNRNFASNRSGFTDARYLTSDLKQIPVGNAVKTLISYNFDNVKITQRLVPVTKQLYQISGNEVPQYYKIEYEFENLSDNEKEVGLTMFFDTQVAENDACWMEPKPAQFLDAYQQNALAKQSPFDRFFFGLFGGKYGKEHLYSGASVPPVILAYRNKWKKTDDLTSVFITSKGEAVKPDELMICRWPFYYGILWDYTNPNSKSPKYTDSAVLMRWKEMMLKAGEKKRFATYYGLYQPDTLTIKYQDTYNTLFSAIPNVITEGDNTTLTWETQNKLKADIFITGLDGKQPDKGSVQIQPPASTVYEMKMVYNGKVIGTWTAPVTVLSKPSKIKESDDGRFTLGYDNKSLTFGYPFPYSTSHFIINSDTKTASNYSGVGADVEYLTGNLKINEGAGSPQSYITFSYDSLIIGQRLIAVNKNLKELPIDSGGSYYKIEYNIVSTAKKKKQVGFALMLDVAPETNDGGIYKANGKKIAVNSTISGHIPDEISVFKDSSQTKRTAHIILNESNTQVPDEIGLGLWQQFNTTKWKINPVTKDYTHDYAMLLKWYPKSITREHPLKFAVYFGESDIKKIVANHHRKEDTKSDAVFFAVGKYDLTKVSQETLKKLVKDENYAYFTVEGFTDPTGSEESNYILSQNRVKSTIDFLKSLGVAENFIISKSHGEYFAGKNSQTVNKERRVVVTLYRKIIL